MLTISIGSEPEWMVDGMDRAGFQVVVEFGMRMKGDK